MKRVRSILLSLLKADPAKASKAARQRGGVSIVDENGVERFRLWIPSEPLL